MDSHTQIARRARSTQAGRHAGFGLLRLPIRARRCCRELLPLTALALLALASPGLLAAELAVPGAYPTITAALAAASEGDIIHVAPGTYSTRTGETFPLRLDKAITLLGALGPVLEGDGQHTVVLIESGGVTVRGFRITNGKGSEGINLMDGGGVCVFVGPSETRPVRIENCMVENNTCPSDETYDGCGGGIYCGGTYCTCFEIHIANCIIRNNTVHGDGGGVFCALLSNVQIKDTVIEQNRADDHGGGVFVDVFSRVSLANTRLVQNNCPGDPVKANWGGKGGGLACESFGVFGATNCLFAQNTAKYFGGGIFSRGGLFAGEGLCGEGPDWPQVSNSLISSNRTEGSGGGVYVASNGTLGMWATTNYWNEAAANGGGIYVAGVGSTGGDISLAGGCLLEGNECAVRGGGLYLGPGGYAVLADTRLLGNSSLSDGGALVLDAGAKADLTNCLLTYNNAARGYGGGLRLLSGAKATLDRCSVVGNFAPWGRSGLVLSTNATVSVTNSILWRNAGGSVQNDGGTVGIGFSLNEDGAIPAQNVIAGSPCYVGWGAKTSIHVDASFTGGGDGTAANPFRDLQVALDGYDFRLAAGSPCLGAASDRGNLGSDTGVGGTPGNTVAQLHLAAGTYDIRGRNIIFTRGLLGAGSASSFIRHAVFGYVEDTFVRDLSIGWETLFGGIATRADVLFENCRVFANTAGSATSPADAGGIYVAEGHCHLTGTEVSGNTSYGNGGGVYLSPGTRFTVEHSQILRNTANMAGGGCFASNLTTNAIAASTIGNNWSTSYGGGLRLGGSTTIEGSVVGTNTARAHGGGIYAAGSLEILNSTVRSNCVDAPSQHGGGIYVSPSGNVFIRSALISLNRVNDNTGGGGGIRCEGKTRIYDSQFVSNSANCAGGLSANYQDSPYCDNCVFSANNAYWNAGGAGVWGCSPYFINCIFTGNTAGMGGAVALNDDRAVFERCNFTSNRASTGGALWPCCSSAATFVQCGFTNNGATWGGTGYLNGSATCHFVGCTIVGSQATESGGALCLDESAKPRFKQVLLADNRAAKNGGAIACVKQPHPFFQDVIVSNCTAVLGGGIYADGGISEFLRCQFFNNTAASSIGSADGGGANFTQNAEGRFTHCTFANNLASDDGGAFACAGSSVVFLTNCFLLSNTAGNTGGGAYFTASSRGILQNCTVAGNRGRPEGGGGGIYQDDSRLITAPSSVVADGMIVFANSPDGIAHKGGTLVANYCCLQETRPGTGNLNVDPLLDPAAFFLLDGSPCIDTGNPSAALNDACLPPGKGTVRNDMGATGGPYNCGGAPQGEFEFASFGPSPFLVLRGNALMTNSVLRLTEAKAYQAGAAWYAFPVHVQSGFQTVFRFKTDRDGSDGFAFVIQDASLASLGGNGGSLGYDGIPNSMAIEFDTYGNSAYGDSNGNHISVQTRGVQPNSVHHQYSLNSSTNIPSISDNRPHTVKVAYVPGQLQVFLDDLQNARLTVAVDLNRLLYLTEGEAFVGFTAGTGAGYETHDILNWSFVSASVLDGDTDGDGMPDWWERAYFGSTTLADRQSDQDGDGLLDWQEFVAGTSPKDAASCLRIEEVQVGPDEIVLRWSSAPNRIYRIHRSETLPSVWTEAASVMGDGSLQTWTEQQSEGVRRFYRLSVEMGK